MVANILCIYVAAALVIAQAGCPSEVPRIWPEILDTSMTLDAYPGILFLPFASCDRKAIDTKKGPVKLVWKVSAQDCGSNLMKCLEIETGSLIPGSPAKENLVLSSRAMPASLTRSRVPSRSFLEMSPASLSISACQSHGQEVQ